MFDSGLAAVTGGSIGKIQVAGVAGVPVAGSGISAVAVNIIVDDRTGQSGFARLWAADQDEPGTSDLSFTGTDGTRLVRSTLVVVPLSGDGAIKLHNLASPGSGGIRYILDVEGWYTGGSVIAYQQTRTQSAVTVQAVGTPNATAVTYQYRSGTSGAWTVLPADTTSSVLTRAGSATAYTGGQPIADNGTAGSFDPYVWDVAKTVGTTNSLLLQIQACYTVPNTTATPCDTPQNLQYAPTFGDSHATDSVGPGTLSLQTGGFQIAATDVSVAGYDGALSVGRSLTTRSPVDADDSAIDASSVFGPGWTASFPGPDSGDGEAYVDDHTADQGYVQIVQSDGSTDTFLLTSQNLTAPTATAPSTYAPVGDATPTGAKLTKYNEGTGTGPAHFKLVDADGTVTVWNYTAAAPVKWNVASVQKPGTGTAATYIRDGNGLVTRLLAATPAGITCTGGVDPTKTPGCRGLDFSYSNTTSGSTKQRLTDITLFAPIVTNTTNNTVVAHYDYSNGRLLDEYDPRLTPNLKTTYANFDANGRLTGMTGPGQQPWTFSYDAVGRLSAASHPTFVAGSTTATSATTTVVYGVPITGRSALPDLSSTSAAAWGQTDLPYTATAVFDPTKVPASTDPATVTAAEYRYADLTYIDPDGNPVNTASYGVVAGTAGWQFGASAFNADGNDIWTITAAERSQAMTPTAATDPWVKTLTTSAARAKWLRSDSSYDPLHPTEETDTYGPVHQIKLASGATVEARDHTANTYDQGDITDRPALGAGDPDYQLVTSSMTSPQIVAADGSTTDGTGADVRETDYSYSRIDRSAKSTEGNGWTLRTPVTTTVVGFGAPSLTTVTRYNQAGQLTEKRLPAAAATASADTTVTTYYAATGTGTCNNSPAVAGLVCRTAPGAAPTLVGTGNPGTAGPTGATTTTSYDSNDNPTVVTEADPAFNSQPAVTRTTITHYDPAERKDWDLTTTAHADSTALAGNTDLPKTTYGYDPGNGQLTSTNWVDAAGNTSASIVTRYDADAHPVTYTDTTGNTSTATYDIAGRIITSTDARGTYTYTYDGRTDEHRGLVTGLSIATGTTGGSTVTTTFGAGYDADSRMVTETYPNGLKASTGFDNDGNTTSLSYALGSTNWLSFAATIGADSRVTAQTASRAGVLQSSQNYSYDYAGRLSQVQDTIAATGICTTRAYYFDVNSNRTALTSADGTAGGACPTALAAPATPQNFYDTADHMVNIGYGYDQLGRTLTVPGADSHGIGPNVGTTGDMAVSYWGNDLVNTETQTGGAGRTLTYSLDPNTTRISTITDIAAGATTGTITANHYDGDNDDPDWTSTATLDTGTGTTTPTGWSRLLEGPDGDLGATVTQDGVVTLDLANLHGDIVATANSDVNATGTATYSETTEYGAPRDPNNAQTPYGWTGEKRRSDQDLAGLITMGVRLYNPATGRFLQTDPVEGGSANDYVYPTDPINGFDLTGQWWHHRWHWRSGRSWRHRYHSWRRTWRQHLNVSGGLCVGVCVNLGYQSGHYYVNGGQVGIATPGLNVGWTHRTAQRREHHSYGFGGGLGYGLYGNWGQHVSRGHFSNVWSDWEAGLAIRPGGIWGGQTRWSHTW